MQTNNNNCATRINTTTCTAAAFIFFSTIFSTFVDGIYVAVRVLVFFLANDSNTAASKLQEKQKKKKKSNFARQAVKIKAGDFVRKFITLQC